MARISSSREIATASWRRIGAIALGGVLLFAAGSKLWNIYAFEFAVDSMILAAIGPGGGAAAPIGRSVILAAIMGECAIGSALVFFARNPRVPAVAAVAMLMAFTGVLGWLLTLKSPPPCGCLGSMEGRLDPHASLWLALVRNASLVALAAWLSIRANPVRPFIRGARAGFTLVETLVVIAVIAVIVAIMIPVLGHARRASKQTQALSGIRQCAVALEQYAGQERDYLPYLATPGEPEAPILQVYNLGAINPPTYFRGQTKYWPTALLELGLDLSQLPDVEASNDKPPHAYTYYWLTHAAFARPEYWVGEAPPSVQNLFAGVRLDEAAFPSSKGLLCDVALLETEPDAWGVALADGAAERKSRLNPSVHIERLRRGYGAVPWRVLTTPDGIRGRDY